MKNLKIKSILSCAVLVAMISGVQSSHAMPVPQDGSRFDAQIDDIYDKTMNIKGITDNNVLNWQTFDITSAETVKFDNGEKIRNYLNLIHDNKASEILGTLIGGSNVYLINPNGVIFGNNSSVNVGNLYVSTRPLDKINADGFEKDGVDPLDVSATKALGDIVNLGNMCANSVYLEGDNVTLTTESVKDVTKAVVGAQGEINVCFADGEMPATEVNNDQFKNKPDIKNITNVEWQDLAGNGRNDMIPYWQIRNVYELQNMKNNLSANYALVTDIDATTTEGWNDGAGFQPVGTGYMEERTEYFVSPYTGRTYTEKIIELNYNNAFTGKFNGLNHRIDDLYINRPKEDYIGLFGLSGNAVVENLSINGQICGGLYVGALMGYNNAGTIRNITNEGTVKGMYVGGLVGYNDDGRVSGVNKGEVMGEALLWEYELDEFGHVILDDHGTAMYVEKELRADYVGGLVGYSGRRSSQPGVEAGVVSGTNAGTVTGKQCVGGLVGANDAKVIGQNFGKIIGQEATGGLVGENSGTVQEEALLQFSGAGGALLSSIVQLPAVGKNIVGNELANPVASLLEQFNAMILSYEGLMAADCVNLIGSRDALNMNGSMTLIGQTLQEAKGTVQNLSGQIVLQESEC